MYWETYYISVHPKELTSETQHVMSLQPIAHVFKHEYLCLDCLEYWQQLTDNIFG